MGAHRQGELPSEPVAMRMPTQVMWDRAEKPFTCPQVEPTPPAMTFSNGLKHTLLTKKLDKAEEEAGSVLTIGASLATEWLRLGLPKQGFGFDAWSRS